MNIKKVTIVVLSIYSTGFCTQPLTIMTAPLGKTGCGRFGPNQVTKSLLQGLDQLGIAYIYNPTSVEQVTDTVIVLANIQALMQAITLKQQGTIRKLLAGPNLMIKADEYGGILASPEIDVCIVPSAWVQEAYEEQMPSLKGRIRCWYAGVDTVYWDGHHAARSHKKNVLVYWKTEPEAFITALETVIKSHGLHPRRIRYGCYLPEQYKALLQQCTCAIFVSRSESQGIALAEAWAMNVPTLVWDPGVLHAHDYVYCNVSACPYLTEYTGYSWKTLQDLHRYFTNKKHRVYSPRAWVQRHMTTRVSAQVLLDIINE